MPELTASRMLPDHYKQMFNHFFNATKVKQVVNRLENAAKQKNQQKIENAMFNHRISTTVANNRGSPHTMR